MRLIVVLGYLGSGKTTFITQALKSFKGEKNAVIVNDFGKRDVDGIILQDKVSTVKKIYDGSIFCSCKSEQFVDTMLETIKAEPDNIIVEASGLANPYTMLRELNLIENKGGVCLQTNIFCLVNVSNFERILSVCHAIKIQTAVSDVVVLNKTDLADSVTIERVHNLVKEITNGKIIQSVNSRLDKYFGYEIVDKPLPPLIEDIVIQKLTLKVKECTLKKLDEVCRLMSQVCHRIKGVINIQGKPMIYEFTDGKSSTLPCECEQSSFLVILSCLKSSLKNNIENIISSYDFLEIE